MPGLPAQPRPLLWILFCFCLQAATALLLVPAWQNPDEPQHLMSIRQVLRYGSDYSITELDPVAEQAIVQSMAEQGWWTHYGYETPRPVPLTFADGPSRVVDAYFGPPDGGSRLYYVAMARLFGLAGIESLIAQLYTVRFLSAAAALLTVVCVWLASRAALGDVGAMATTAALALHPQFVIVSTTASPDAIVNLAGAVIWWQFARMMGSVQSGPALLIIWTVAVAAFLTRRVGAPLLFAAAWSSWVWLASGRLQRLRLSWRPALAAASALAAVVAFSMTWLSPELSRAAGWVAYDPLQAAVSAAGDISRLPTFVDALFRTFWLAAGWLRYFAPGWWYAIALCVSLIAAAGLTQVRWRDGRLERFALALVVVQLAAVVGLYFGILRTSGQGRYLFPVLPAIVFLLWRGWEAALSRFGAGRLAALSFVGLLALLNLSAWVFVLMPGYL